MGSTLSMHRELPVSVYVRPVVQGYNISFREMVYIDHKLIKAFYSTEIDYSLNDSNRNAFSRKLRC